MRNFNDTTSIKINREKKNLVKSKGIKLQDLLDDAINWELGISDEKSLNKEKINEFLLEINKIENERDNYLNNFDKEMNLLLNDLIHFKSEEEKFYNNKIEILQSKIKYLESL
ncbi:hypothetical protein BGI41_06765 [Methanobrevibacter sp. 87.7]|uniref:hypothetical protein n=1 Tax=Methanobrevibacter sp. 87.7 TaxID=387957 RepID=UPI000B504A45|nr:hypothetical protein [Methanobrevibacter sp. 87.7]OWT32608.1 hypothetical protein BGI41_06765 [Methanobrevibacter sp. 87.7]